jgi:hypothetical protein
MQRVLKNSETAIFKLQCTSVYLARLVKMKSLVPTPRGSFLFFFLLFETGSRYVAQVDLKLVV